MPLKQLEPTRNSANHRINARDLSKFCSCKRTKRSFTNVGKSPQTKRRSVSSIRGKKLALSPRNSMLRYHARHRALDHRVVHILGQTRNRKPPQLQRWIQNCIKGGAGADSLTTPNTNAVPASKERSRHRFAKLLSGLLRKNRAGRVSLGDNFSDNTVGSVPGTPLFHGQTECLEHSQLYLSNLATTVQSNMLICR